MRNVRCLFLSVFIGSGFEICFFFMRFEGVFGVLVRLWFILMFEFRRVGCWDVL